MATLVARLYETGELRAVEFNDWDATRVRVLENEVQAIELDEVTMSAVPQRILSDGTLQVSGFFNEVDPF